jgi:hypothetical protein
VAHFEIVIAEHGGEWVVAVAVDRAVPFVESHASKANAWRAAKDHGDMAGPEDVIDVRCGTREARSLTGEQLTDWLRAAWRG